MCKGFVVLLLGNVETYFLSSFFLTTFRPVLPPVLESANYKLRGLGGGVGGLSQWDDNNSLKQDSDFYSRLWTYLNPLCDPLLSPNKHYIVFFFSKLAIVLLNPLNVYKLLLRTQEYTTGTL